jgi:hypothetical protein
MNAACHETWEALADDDGCVRAGLTRTQPACATVTNILTSAVVAVEPDLRERGRLRPRARATIGVPWVMVLVHAVALVSSSMAGLAMVLFLH